MKASRAEVYAAIDGEREYQDLMGEANGWGEGAGASNHSVGDFIVLMDEYLARAKKAYADSTGNMPSLDVIRKVAGIAVNCLEKHGAPERAIPSHLDDFKGWQRRVRLEKVQLDRLIGRLEAAQLLDTDQNLKDQLEAMREYSAILQKRIDTFA